MSKTARLQAIKMHDADDRRAPRDRGFAAGRPASEPGAPPHRGFDPRTPTQRIGAAGAAAVITLGIVGSLADLAGHYRQEQRQQMAGAKATTLAHHGNGTTKRAQRTSHT